MGKLRGHAVFLLPWLGLFCVLIAVPAAWKSSAPVLGKTYALIATILASVHFFRESNWKKQRDALANAEGGGQKSQDMITRSQAILEAALTGWSPAAVRLMRLALIFAGASFLLDLLDTLSK